jgi:hypothetical protein
MTKRQAMPGSEYLTDNVSERKPVGIAVELPPNMIENLWSPLPLQDWPRHLLPELCGLHTYIHTYVLFIIISPAYSMLRVPYSLISCWTNLRRNEL